MKIKLPLAAVFFVLSCIFAHGQSGVVIAEKANLRGTPSQSGKIMAELSEGDKFEQIKRSGPWFLIQADEYVGWVHGNTIRLNQPKATAPVTLGGYMNIPESKPEPYVFTGRPKKFRYPVSSRTLIRGPRGGCYYWTSGGTKVYVDRSMCN